MKYSIRVNMTPYHNDSPRKPHYWQVYVHSDNLDSWRMVDSGWSKSPDAAWDEAKASYKKITGGAQNDDGRSA